MFRMPLLWRMVSVALLIALAVAETSAAPAAAPEVAASPAAKTAAEPKAESKRLVYRVSHSTYGNIGTYSNSIQISGDTTVVKTVGQMKVSVLGIVMYRQDISRTERWNGDRLMSFHGTTKVNDRTMEISGEAEGNQFLVMSPGGDRAVPGDIRIANPWSKDLLKGNFVLTPDRGVLEQVSVSDMEDTMVALEKGSVRATHYRVQRGGDAQRSYELWLDERGTPVKFAVNNPNGAVTFTLMNG